MAIPKRVSDRLITGIKKFQPILNEAKSRDIGEADTVTIVKDMLADIFGYDKYSEITSEHAIRGTYCDLAIKLDGVLQTLIEIKAIGTVLKDTHIKQAVDYAANEGVDWVALTNGMQWKVFKVHFTKPIDFEEVINLDFATLNSRNSSDLDMLYLWCKEGWVKSMVGDYYEQKQVLSRYYIGAILLTEPVLKDVKQTLRKIAPNVKVDIEQIKRVIANEVLKREILEGDKAEKAKSKLSRAENKAIREASRNREPIQEAAIPLPIAVGE